MKVLIKAGAKGFVRTRFGNDVVELKAGEHDLDPKLVEFLQKDIPGGITILAAETPAPIDESGDEIPQSPNEQGATLKRRRR